MHRTQDTTKNNSGLYFAKSTEGHFSVLMPIPFNDFTVKGDGAAVYMVGSKSSEGIKFSVSEVQIKDSTKEIDLDELVKGFDVKPNVVSNVEKKLLDNTETISFTVIDKSKAALFKYVKLNSKLITMIIEFPIAYKTIVETEFDYFFTSLEVDAE